MDAADPTPLPQSQTSPHQGTRDDSAPPPAAAGMSRVRRLLAEVSVMSLATVDESGLPHGANVYFAADETLELFFISSPDSAHSVHAQQRPDVAATIYPEVADYTQIRGLQLRGTVRAVADDQWETGWAVYLEKFPFVAQLADLARSQRMYCLTPAWLRYIDNAIAFGFKWETSWPTE